MDEASKRVAQPAANTQTSNSGPPKTEVTINDLPLAVLPLIFNNVSPLTKLKTLALVSKAFNLASQQKAAWTSVKALVFTENELDLEDPLQLKLPVTDTVSSEQIEQYKRLIGWLSQITFIQPASFMWYSSYENELFVSVEQLNLFALRRHIGTVRFYDTLLSARSTKLRDNQMMEINLLHQAQVKVRRIGWNTGEFVVNQQSSEYEYNRLLAELSCSVMHVNFGGGAAAHLHSDLARSFHQGRCIPVLAVHFWSVAGLQSFVHFVNGLTAGSLKELRFMVVPGDSDNTQSHIYKRIHDEQLHALKKLSMNVIESPNDLAKFTLPAIMIKTPNLECIELLHGNMLQDKVVYDRLSDLIIPLWQLRIGRTTALTQTELTILLPDVSQFANKEQVLADLNSRLGAAENGVGLDGGLTFATAQIDRLLENGWRVRIWEPKTNTQLSLRFAQPDD